MDKEQIINEIQDLEDQINTKTKNIVSALIQNNDTFSDALEMVKQNFLMKDNDSETISLFVFDILTDKILEVAEKQATPKE